MLNKKIIARKRLSILATTSLIAIQTVITSNAFEAEASYQSDPIFENILKHRYNVSLEEAKYLVRGGANETNSNILKGHLDHIAEHHGDDAKALYVGHMLNYPHHNCHHVFEDVMAHGVVDDVLEAHALSQTVEEARIRLGNPQYNNNDQGSDDESSEDSNQQHRNDSQSSDDEVEGQNNESDVVRILRTHGMDQDDVGLQNSVTNLLQLGIAENNIDQDTLSLAEHLRGVVDGNFNEEQLNAGLQLNSILPPNNFRESALTAGVYLQRELGVQEFWVEHLNAIQAFTVHLPNRTVFDLYINARHEDRPLYIRAFNNLMDRNDNADANSIVQEFNTIISARNRDDSSDDMPGSNHSTVTDYSSDSDEDVILDPMNVLSFDSENEDYNQAYSEMLIYLQSNIGIEDPSVDLISVVAGLCIRYGLGNQDFSRGQLTEMHYALDKVGVGLYNYNNASTNYPAQIAELPDLARHIQHIIEFQPGESIFNKLNGDQLAAAWALWNHSDVGEFSVEQLNAATQLHKITERHEFTIEDLNLAIYLQTSLETEKFTNDDIDVFNEAKYLYIDLDFKGFDLNDLSAAMYLRTLFEGNDFTFNDLGLAVHLRTNLGVEFFSFDDLEATFYLQEHPEFETFNYEDVRAVVQLVLMGNTDPDRQDVEDVIAFASRGLYPNVAAFHLYQNTSDEIRHTVSDAFFELKIRGIKDPIENQILDEMDRTISEPNRNRVTRTDTGTPTHTPEITLDNDGSDDGLNNLFESED